MAIVFFLSNLFLFAIVITHTIPATIDASLFYSINAFAQEIPQEHVLNSTDNMIIGLNSARFAPLTDSTVNQFKILVAYERNDPTLVNTPMAGFMIVYHSDGSLLKTSSIPKGYVVGQSGIVQFATSFSDQTIKYVRACVYMNDTQGDVISNMLSVDESLTR